MELYTKKQAAAVLKISTVTIDRLRHSGALPYRKIGAQVRFLPEDLQKYLETSLGSAWKSKTRSA
jgi:excisionase family DNA binding protein